MASSYKIERVVSSGKKGAQEVTVRFGKKSVTRHLINGRGKHPDDSIPELHAQLNKRVGELQGALNKLDEGIKNAEREVEKNGPQADEAKRFLPIARIARATTDARLKDATDARDREEVENPLFVQYLSGELA
jgi:hypothetical protein